MGYIKKEKIENRPCVCCKTNYKIWNRIKWLCKDCDKKRKSVKTNRNSLEEESNNLQSIFEEIWNERTHYCYHCGVYLGNEFRPIFFSHILSRGAHPKLRCDKDNIVLACSQCHRIYDFGDRKKLKYQIPDQVIEKLIKKERNE